MIFIESNPQILLKEAFLEFFRKLLPSVIDPENIIKSRWILFRNLLLDETKSP
jgi:hypothetical protein